jgi:molybdopterin/thiamine biosynthesis adenylyltransferase
MHVMMMDRLVCNGTAFGEDEAQSAARQQRLATMSVNVCGDTPAAHAALFNLIGLGVGDIHWFAQESEGHSIERGALATYLEELAPETSLHIQDGYLIPALAGNGPIIDASHKSASHGRSRQFAYASNTPLLQVTQSIKKPVAPTLFNQPYHKRRRLLASPDTTEASLLSSSRIAAGLLGGTLAANLCRRHAFSFEEKGESQGLETTIQASLFETDFQLSARHQDIIIVGAGGIGTFALLTLGYLGVHSVEIVDFDTVEAKNLNRQILYGNAIGDPKAAAAASFMRKWFKMQSVSYDDKVCDDNKKYWTYHLIYSKATSILGCVDNNRARMYLSELAMKTNRRFIEGACNPYQGILSHYIPQQTHTAVCQRRLEAEQETTETSTTNTASCADVPNPSIITPNAIMGILAAYMTVASGAIPKNHLLHYSSLEPSPFSQTEARTNNCRCRL